MKVATYNILKGGSQRVHWLRMIEDFGVCLLLTQESYPHDEHLPLLLYPDARKQSAWEMAEKNGWESDVYSRTGPVIGASLWFAPRGRVRDAATVSGTFGGDGDVP